MDWLTSFCVEVSYADLCSLRVSTVSLPNIQNRLQSLLGDLVLPVLPSCALLPSRRQVLLLPRRLSLVLPLPLFLRFLVRICPRKNPPPFAIAETRNDTYNSASLPNRCYENHMGSNLASLRVRPAKANSWSLLSLCQKKLTEIVCS